MSNITVTHRDEIYRFKSFVFPGGEVGIKFDKSERGPRDYLTFTLKAKSAHDLIELAMVKDAAERQFSQKQSCLKLPYIPYARQDRVCDEGEAFSLKVFCDYLNFLGFDNVEVVDPHSDVAPALINNVIVVKQEDIVAQFPELISAITHGAVLVSPDAGASKKTQAIARRLQRTEYIRADKLRNLSTGEVLETIVYKDDFKGQDVVVCDDIADGARTFIELAKICKAKNCGKFSLYVTHGIFSKGIVPILDSGIDHVFTTDSFRSIFPEHPRLTVLRLNHT